MNCSYHIHNPAVVECNGCGKALCTACDHRIKGFPYCQDCIVQGIDLLRQHNRNDYVPFVKKQTSPVIALLLSFICPGLGAAYNGQTVKALVYFGVFIGLFQLAIITDTVMFVLAFLGMWLFAMLDAWRTARMIRSGITPDAAEDLLVRRFSGNPKLWGVVLTIIGGTFLLQSIFPIHGLMRAILPISLIGLGIYVLRGYIFNNGYGDDARPSERQTASFAGTLPPPDMGRTEQNYEEYRRSGGWRG